MTSHLQRASSRSAPRPLTGGMAMSILGAFFLVMFGANGALIYSALHTLHGEETENSYEASQIYNQRIAAAQAQDALGWKVEVTARPEAEGVHIVADFRDREGAPIPGLSVKARFIHPFDHGADREAALESDGGAYEGAAPPLHEGKWTLHLEARQGGAIKFMSDNPLVLGPVGG